MLYPASRSFDKRDLSIDGLCFPQGPWIHFSVDTEGPLSVSYE